MVQSGSNKVGQQAWVLHKMYGDERGKLYIFDQLVFKNLWFSCVMYDFVIWEIFNSTYFKRLQLIWWVNFIFVDSNCVAVMEIVMFWNYWRPELSK